MNFLARDYAIKLYCENDFKFFIRYVFKEFYNVTWLNNWHHDAIIDFIKGLEARTIPNAVINIPPRYGKTELVVILWISWTIIRNPSAQFIHASYSDGLALKNSATIRAILAHECIQKYWQIKMRTGTDSKGLWLTEQGGGLLAGAAGGSITGFGAGVTSWNDGEPFDGAIIIDDPLKPDDAYSDTMRTTVNERLAGTFHSRRNHPKVPIVIVMQRLHENDASAFAINGELMGDKFDCLSIPAINDAGLPLWERKHSLEQLNVMRGKSAMVFAGQYMQQPAPAEGGLYKVRWFEQRHEYVAPFNGFERIMLSVDGAFTSKQQNDASAITAWGIKSNNAYLLDCHNVRMDYPELETLITQIYAQHKAQGVLVENKASGLVLIPALRKAGLSVIEINPIKDKVSRVVQSTTPCEAGRVLLPKYANWLHKVEQQMFFFPNAKHDDIVDSVSQFINWWQGSGAGLDYERIYGY
jgi:predicted phage terminase large subunit-like protein